MPIGRRRTDAAVPAYPFQRYDGLVSASARAQRVMQNLSDLNRMPTTVTSICSRAWRQRMACWLGKCRDTVSRTQTLLLIEAQVRRAAARQRKRSCCVIGKNSMLPRRPVPWAVRRQRQDPLSRAVHALAKALRMKELRCESCRRLSTPAAQRHLEASSTGCATTGAPTAAYDRVAAHDIVERLRFAREQAVARARHQRRQEAVTALSMQAGGDASAVLGGPPSVWLRLASALPLLVLVAGS